MFRLAKTLLNQGKIGCTDSQLNFGNKSLHTLYFDTSVMFKL